MKKVQYTGVVIIAMAIIVFDTMAAAQSAHKHRWRKISESTDVSGRILCTWECETNANNLHQMVTGAYGECVEPPT